MSSHHSASSRTGASDHSHLRSLPSVQSVISHSEVQPHASVLDSRIVTEIVRDAISDVRRRILSGDVPVNVEAEVIDQTVTELAAVSNPRLREVINATGVIVHTNLGRAPVSRATADAMSRVASQYTPLELEIESGKRGGRMSEISRLLRLLTGAEDSLVVNNNAAAVLLVLSALCYGKQVILSRSQAVEIGGGFRIPSVLMQSGAHLVEVGTTNRTYIGDYEAAITEDTGALLTVHWSNFRIVGFTNQPTLEELSELARSRSLPLIEDLGSGSLLETAPYGITPEPTVTESIQSGVDVVCFSGDKLLGGPQAGIISGKRDLIRTISQHPLARAVRADKTALAGVAETLRHYARGEALSEVPVWRMISEGAERLRARCENWLDQLGHPHGVRIVQTHAAIGGGSLPGESLPSWGLAIATRDPDRLAYQLRTSRPAVMPHIEDDRLILDARTVLRDQDSALLGVLRQSLDSSRG